MGRINIGQTIKKYWFDEQTNVFNNYIDAIFGLIVLVCFPALTVLPVAILESVDWFNYVFPIISVSCAGMYDAYGRYTAKSPRNLKLGMRVSIDVLAIVLAALFCGVNSRILWAIPPVMLFVCGIGLVVEALERIKVAIEISEWSVFK